MITPLLHTVLEPVVSRHRNLRRLRWQAAGWAALAAGVAVCFAFKFQIPELKVITVGLALLIWWLAARAAQGWQPNVTEVARRIEERHPELHALLVTAVEQKPEPKSGRLHFLQQRIIQQAIEESRKTNWLDAVPAWRLWSLRGLMLGLTLAILALIFRMPTSEAKPTAAVAKMADGVTVNPGDTALERGSGLIVLANFHRDVPGEATLVIQSRNQSAQRIPLIKNLDDPVFGGGLPEVDGDLTYRIEYAGQATRDFSVKVFEHPRLDRADATLHFPEYTKLPEKTVPDTRRVSAVEGTKLDVAFQLNKPVKSATLVAKDGTTVPLDVAADKSAATLKDFAIKKSQSYELKLEDADGRANKMPAQFIVEAVPNRRPELKFLTPKGDQRVSPIEEVAFRAEAWDDFGLARYGLTVNIAGRGPQQLELGQETRADEKKEILHLLKLEDLGVKPDELVSWFLWAEDIGPDGKPRRTETDMYFAEVRPFEEIYRRGDDGEDEAGGAAGGEGEATKLAELQKQIISATWNLQRSEDANTEAQKPSGKYLEGEPVVRDSQADALKKASAMAGKIEDPKMRGLAENAAKEMQTALDHLSKADKTPAPLPDALGAEQSAYNALLKLAAHEFRVKKGKGKGQSNGKQQQQLDQLEMQDEKKRYETKSEAEAPQQEQQRDQLAILNRLKELAQRQQDVNERVKELQTALLAAKTEPEKEEIRRQLKRLREEEQQMLADLDETRQKMEQSPQQAQMANERQQLDKTRAEAQKAAEAMEKGQTSQALASGTRTQRDLQQMRDDFRKKTSGQFKDDMREMRADARDLAEKQQEIAEKLKPETGKQERRTLDSSNPREQLAEQFAQQQQKLGKITEKMKEVSEQAEAAEPLLAKELYDTLRKTTQAGTGETLEKTQQLAQRGYNPQAQKFEEKARQEIDELKSGVERAAESVLGDEAEALRQARAELDTLKSQLDREIARARPDLAEANAPAGNQKSAGSSDAKDGAAPGAQTSAPPGTNGEGAKAPQTGDGQQPREDGQKSAAGEKPSDNPPAAGQKGDEGQPPGQGGKEAGGQTAAQKPSPAQGEGQAPGQDGQGKQGQAAAGKGTPGEGQGQGAGEGQPPGQNGKDGQGQAATRKTSAPQGDGNGPQPGQGGKGDGGQTASQNPGGAPAQAGKPGTSPGGDGTGATARNPGGDPNGPRQSARLSQLATAGRAGANNSGGGAGGGGTDTDQGGPLTGDQFAQWSDRLRNVEEMVDDRNLRTEVARVREIAKGIRVEYKQHSAQPDWDMVKSKIGKPLVELRDRLTEELARRESKENLVPIDRDPVPTKYAERVRRYYEELGRSR